MVDALEWIQISELAFINPSLEAQGLSPDSLVSFIPMADVSNDGHWTTRRVSRFEEVAKGYTSFQDGDVLFAKITPCTENGKGAHVKGLVNGIGFGSTEFHVLRSKDLCDARYLYHWSQSERLRSRAAAVMTGSAGQQRVPASFFERYAIPLFSLPEQRRIAEILDTADEAIRQTERVIAKLREVKQGLLHDLLTRGLDAGGHLRDPIAHPEQFKDSPLGRIPREWVQSFVEEEFEVTTGFTLGSHRRPRNHIRLYLRVANVLREQILLDDITELEARDDEMVGRILEENDLLVVEGHANPHEIGRCARVPPEAVGLTFQNHLFRLRSRGINTRFALAWLNGGWVRDHWRRSCRTSSGLNTINSTMLKQLPVIVPPSSEQHQIAEVLDAHDARIRAEEEVLAKRRQLKRGLMEDLLTGRVRVM